MKSNTKEPWVKTIVATEKGYKKKERKKKKTSQKVRFKWSFVINDSNFTSWPRVLSLLPSPLAIRRLKGQPITPRALHAVLLMKSGGRKVCERACMCVFFGMKRANGSRLIMRAGEHALAGALHRRYLCWDHISKRPRPLCLCISSPAIYHFTSPRPQGYFSSRASPLHGVIFLPISPIQSSDLPLSIFIYPVIIFQHNFYFLLCLCPSLKGALIECSFGLKGWRV